MTVVRRRGSILATIVAAAILLLPASASAHVGEVPTSLSIQMRGGPVSEGETFTITGKLSGHRQCRPGRTIQLIRVGTGVIATTVTDSEGRYRFELVATEPMRLKTRFNGAPVGVHPHSHICEPSTSRTLRVKIRGDGDGNDDDGDDGDDGGGGGGDDDDDRGTGGGSDVLGTGGTVDGSGTQGATGDGGAAFTAFTGSDATVAAISALGLLALGAGALALVRARRRSS